MSAKHNNDQQVTYTDIAPKDTWTQVLPRLWMGATDDDDTLGHELAEPRITLEHFDTVVSLHAWSNPADWHVREIRQPFHDGELDELNFDDLWFLVNTVYDDWMSGKRVLVRCLSGLNRSALVLALVLIMAGHSSAEAISTIRNKRSKYALCNEHFAKWLLEIDETDWRRQ